ncbi:Uncharacterised protein [Enterobacter cloacae]|nr:Uncharacterised protein [Enterobacter cloacae]
MIRIGTVQTTASTLLECDQLGLYFASLLLARYFQAKPTAIKMAGITTINIRPKAVSINERCSSPICPLGSSSAESQPLSNTVPANNDNHPKLLLYFLSLI